MIGERIQYKVDESTVSGNIRDKVASASKTLNYPQAFPLLYDVYVVERDNGACDIVKPEDIIKFSRNA